MSDLSLPQLLEQLKSLDKERNDLENQIAELNDSEKALLGDKYELGCKLIDDENYPINVDVYTITHIRKERLEKTNDLRNTVQSLQNIMLQLHSSLPDNEEENDEILFSNDKSEESTSSITQTVQSPPFMRIFNIASDSPIENAGFCENDRLIVCGTYDHDKWTKSIEQGVFHGEENPKEYALLQFSSYLGKSENTPLSVILVRSEGGVQKIISTEFTPQRWSGPGLLGCRISYDF